MRIKIISIILTLATIFSLMTSCADNEDKNNKPKEEPVSYDGIVIDNEYAVVRSNNANQSKIKAAVYLRQEINSKASLDVAIKTDFFKKEEEIAEKEILVGEVKRETEFDRTTLKEGEYYIGIEGKKIIIDAYDDALLYFAVKEFASKWLTKDLGIQKDGALLINEDICNSVNGIDVYPEHTIRILTQNMWYSEDQRATRMQRFQQLIDKYDPDIIGTQETTNKWLSDFKSKLGGEYGVVGCSRDGRNATGGEWNAILYKLDRFELLDSDTFWLTDTPSEKSRLEGSLCNRICTWALLKDKQSGETFLMANTHLDHGPDSVREQQAKILLKQLKSKLAKYPTYITGDFNFTPDSAAYSIVNKSCLDAHKQALLNKSSVSNTFSPPTPSKEIDFCFYNDKSIALSYYIVSEQFDKGYVSDHFGVLSEFALK